MSASHETTPDIIDGFQSASSPEVDDDVQSDSEDEYTVKCPDRGCHEHGNMPESSVRFIVPHMTDHQILWAATIFKYMKNVPEIDWEKLAATFSVTPEYAKEYNDKVRYVMQLKQARAARYEEQGQHDNADGQIAKEEKQKASKQGKGRDKAAEAKAKAEAVVEDDDK